MRCLYCGIRLKIAEKAKVIRHCPECSLRIEHEGRPDTARAEDRSRRSRPADGHRFAVLAATKSA